MRLRAAVLGIVVLGLAGCGAVNDDMQATIAPSETIEIMQEAATEQPTPTAEPTTYTEAPPQPTDIPPTQTPTPTLVPPLLSSEGPWLIFGGNRGEFGVPLLFALDAATNQVHQISSDDRHLYWRFYMAHADPGNRVVGLVEEHGSEIWLDFLTLPEFTLAPIVNLIPERNSFEEELGALGNAMGGVWHGDKLAFIGAMDPPSTDVYLYEDGVIRLLSDETTMFPRSMEWSPNGDTLVYGVIPGFGEDVCQGNEIMYAVSLSGGEKVTLTPEDNKEAIVVGWVNAHTALIASRPDYSCEWSTLYQVDVTTGQRHIWWKGKFSGAAYDPISGAVVMSKGWSQFYAQYNPEDEKPADAIFLKHGESRALGVLVYDQVHWSEQHQLFLMRSDTDLIAVTTSGEVITLPSLDGWAPYSPSPDGRWMLWSQPDQKYLIGVWGAEPHLTLSGEAYVWTWKPDSSGLYYWTSSGTYYAEAPHFQAIHIDDARYSGSPLQWITP